MIYKLYLCKIITTIVYIIEIIPTTKVKMDILTSIDEVLRHSRHVHINKERVKAFAREVEGKRFDHWLTVSPVDLNTVEENKRLGFLVALNSISFSYFGEPKWTVQYHTRIYDGAQAMMACLGRALEDKIPIYDPAYLATVSKHTLEHILNGNIQIPLFNERLRILNEIGAITQDQFKGDFRYLVQRAQGNSLQLVNLLTQRFPSFEDSSQYRGKRVHFCKRAQLLASDIHRYCGELTEVDTLTACADYKIPQVLRRHGILEYTESLKEKIQSKEEIKRGSEEELEIRAHTIYAVELLKQELRTRTAMEINDYVWLEGQHKRETDEPYHRTRTIAY